MGSLSLKKWCSYSGRTVAVGCVDIAGWPAFFSRPPDGHTSSNRPQKFSAAASFDFSVTMLVANVEFMGVAWGLCDLLSSMFCCVKSDHRATIATRIHCRNWSQHIHFPPPYFNTYQSAVEAAWNHQPIRLLKIQALDIKKVLTSNRYGPLDGQDVRTCSSEQINIWKKTSSSLGTYDISNIEDFLEKVQTAFEPPSPLRRFRILHCTFLGPKYTVYDKQNLQWFFWGAKMTPLPLDCFDTLWHGLRENWKGGAQLQWWMVSYRLLWRKKFNGHHPW